MRPVDASDPGGTGCGIVMFSHGGPVKVYVATRPVDFRKGIDGLALAVQEMFGLDPFCGAVFVFRSKRADRIKLLVWDQTGMVLVHKRLEDARFVWPQVQGGVMRMSSAQLAALFEGLDWRLVRSERARRPLVAG
ncbi:IS66 family insertion sequence element accessory protein TnpB [Frigidibacter mobilis]